MSHVATNRPKLRIFDVRDYGAVGDGFTLDTAAIQRAINDAAASAGPAQVLIRGGRRYLIGTLELKAKIDLHLADNAELVVSTNKNDYSTDAAVTAHDAPGISITGTGSINGRSPEFMDHYEAENEWWRSKEWRPKMLVLTACKDLQIHGITIRQAPSWTVHLVGCEHVLIDGIKIRNQLDVPNCDGIDPDHCRDVEIKNCDIVCGDDAIVIKTTRQHMEYGPSSNITVKDCVLHTQDSGIKIGTETTQDIHAIRFERIKMISGCRGLCIQLRDEGSVYDIDFRDLTFVSRYHSAPWWGRGEALSLTAIPRKPEAKIGAIHDVRLANITGRAENSARINGSPQSHIHNISLENVDLTLDRWTNYPGGFFDNRPTTAQEALEKHGTPGYFIQHADHVLLQKCRVHWGKNVPDYFTHALEANDVTDLQYPGFSGQAAHPQRDQAVSIS